MNLFITENIPSPNVQYSRGPPELIDPILNRSGLVRGLGLITNAWWEGNFSIGQDFLSFYSPLW